MSSSDQRTILIFGASGLLGSDVKREALARGYRVEAPSHAEVDVASDLDLNAYILNTGAQSMINCAAYTAVDKAESEPEVCAILNAATPLNMARYSSWKGLKFLHVSTDFVFDGEKTGAYEETDAPHPLGVYAKSKFHGEQLVQDRNSNAIIARTAWLFGAHGNCFPRTILKAAKAGKPLRVVNDQRGSPSYTRDVAKGLLNLLETEGAKGVYQVVNSGEATWYELATEVLRCVGMNVSVEAISTEDWPTPSPRPANSVLSTKRFQSLGFEPLPDWRDSVARFAAEIAPEL